MFETPVGGLLGRAMAFSRANLSSVVILLFLAFCHTFCSEKTSEIQTGVTNYDHIATQLVLKQHSTKHHLNCPWTSGRHFVSSPRVKGFFSSRQQYCANSTRSFQQIRLFISGDVSLNPGPVTRSQSASLKTISDFVDSIHFFKVSCPLTKA